MAKKAEQQKEEAKGKKVKKQNYQILDPAEEMKTYVNYIEKGGKMPDKKFVILGISRSGSTLLVNLLNSHPKITCEGEILTQRVQYPELYVRSRPTFSKKEVYGFKLLIYHMNGVHEMKYPVKFVSDLHEDGYKVIHLRRLNVLRQALSGLYARHLGTFHMYKNKDNVEKKKMHVNMERLLKKIKVTERKVELEERILKKVPHLSFIYENDLMETDAQKATIDKICDYLELPPTKVATDHKRVTSDSFEDFIENADEMIAFFSKTDYKRFLYL